MMKRLRKPVVLTSLSALVLWVLKTYGLLVPLGLTPDSYKELTTLIFSLLIALGIYDSE